MLKRQVLLLGYISSFLKISSVHCSLMQRVIDSLWNFLNFALGNLHDYLIQFLKQFRGMKYSFFCTCHMGTAHSSQRGISHCGVSASSAVACHVNEEYVSECPEGEHGRSTAEETPFSEFGISG